jgi:glutamine amidotransferase-like uncharacterized protein
MPLDILIYQDGYAALGMMVRALKNSFNDQACTISEINIEDIRNGILQTREPTLLVMPGIYGEDCHYHKDFNEKALDEVHAFLERGGVSLHSCAGASAVSRLCDYVTPWGTIKHQMSLKPVFNGRAQGPLWPYAMQPQPASKGSTLAELADTSIAPVLFKNENGDWEEACISYGNGPGLIPDPYNSDIEILAIYHQIASKPPALIRQSVGRGAAYLCSMHPEVSPIEIDANSHQTFPAIRALSDALKPHEQGRQNLWGMLTNRIKNDLSQ